MSDKPKKRQSKNEEKEYSSKKVKVFIEIIKKWVGSISNYIKIWSISFSKHLRVLYFVGLIVLIIALFYSKERWIYCLIILITYLSIKFFLRDLKTEKLTLIILGFSIFIWAELYYKLQADDHFILRQDILMENPKVEREKTIFFEKIRNALNVQKNKIELEFPEKKEDWIINNDTILINYRVKNLNHNYNDELLIWYNHETQNTTWIQYWSEHQVDPGGSGTVVIEYNLPQFLKILSKGDLGWWNCIYFSVVTVTTVGSGDIFPIHWSSRLAVILQIFYGLLTIGILVNLAYKYFEQNLIKEK